MPAFNDYLELRIAVADLIGNRNISDILPSLTRRAETVLKRTYDRLVREGYFDRLR